MLQSYYKKRVINFAVFVASLMALAGGPVLMSTLSARALNQSTNFVVTIPDVPTLQITLYDDQGNEMDSEDITSMNVTATMATAGFNTKGMSVMVGTSSTAGYHLNMSVANGGQLVSGANSIPSLASETDAEDNPYTCSVATADICNFTENSWGYWMTGFGTNVYKPIPAAETELVNYTTGATDGETTHFSFGVRANAKQPAGNYTTTINYIATANPEPVDNISKVQTMQDFAALSAEEYTAVLASMDPAETYTLADSRDDNTYTIQKLADGRVWMLDNLALGGSTAMTLDSTNTNLADNTTYILPASGTQCFTNQNTTCTGTAGSNNTTTDATKTGNGYTVAAINADYKTTTSANGNNFTYNSNGDVSKAGVYYNYCAASAGTYCYAYNSAPEGTNAQYDICPKGWRLPTGGGSGEFQALTNNLVGETSSFSDTTKYATFKAAFHAGLSGDFYNGSVQNQASHVGFWSSTRYDGSAMYYLYLSTSAVNPQGGSTRYGGYSVRCVLKSAAERELESGMTMQSFASMSSEEKATFIASIPTNATYQMTDVRDDNTYNVAKLADGRVWLLDNLALGGSTAMTLDSTNTNLADNTTYILPASGTVCFTDSSCTGTAGSNNTNTSATKTGTGYTIAAINADYKTTTSANNTDFTYNSNGDVSKAGVYYNYCAASAGTYCYAANSSSGNASYDICPKGWRLPTGGDYVEFRALANNLGNVTSGNLTDTAYTNFKAAFHAGLSGSFYNGSVQDQASYVYFWSSTRRNGNTMYRLSLNTSTVLPQDNTYRYLGVSVRCVLKSSS